LERRQGDAFAELVHHGTTCRGDRGENGESSGDCGGDCDDCDAGADSCDCHGEKSGGRSAPRLQLILTMSWDDFVC